jgi:ABC-2 type transport system permease protein
MGVADFRMHFEGPMIAPRWQALVHMIDARVREFIREPHAVFWVYGFPIILAISLGFAFREAAPEPPHVDVQETPDSARAEAIANRLRNERWADANLKVEILPAEECKQRLKIGKTALYLIVDGDLIEYVHQDARAESVQARYWVEALLARKDIEPKISALDEPGSRYIDFLFPGLMGMNIMGGGLFGVGFVLVDMRVRKLFKRLMATPMRHGDFLLSLLLSRMLFLIPEMLSLLVVSYFAYGVPINGSLVTLALVIFAGSCAFSGIGLLLGSRTEKTEAMSGMMNLIMMPMWIFSGVFFSSKRFPDEVQPFIQALPLTQLNDALREVMLEGKTLWDIGWRLAILASYAVVCFTLALKLFKWR